MSTLQNDIKKLLEAQVISPETASKIEAYYQSQKTNSPNRLFTVFGVLGALLVGLGVILILAHNWDEFSKTTKTIFAYLPLLIGQIAVGYSLFKNKSTTYKEASGTFLFFAVGACMALISQIYNIPGNISSYLLTWLLLCAPLIYLLKSNTLTILHLVFLTYYGCELGYFTGGDKSPWLYIALLAVALPFYINKLKTEAHANSTSVLNWLFPLSVTICLGTFVTNKADYIGYLMYISWFGVLYNIGRLPYFYNQKLRRNGYLVLGSLGTIVLLLFTTFRWFWKDLVRNSDITETFIITMLLIGVGVWLLLKHYAKNKLLGANLFQYVFVIMLVLFGIGLVDNIIPTVLSNILVFVLGISAVKIGADQFHFGILNYGLLIVTALITCRFFDTNMSFVVRGLLFVAVGVGFFITNYIMLKRQREALK